MNKPIVMFDVGAVLLELTYGRFISELSNRNVPDNLIKHYSALEWLDIKGDISKENFHEQAKTIINYDNNSDDVDSVMKLCWGKQVDEMVALKEHIAKRGYAVGILSNMGQYGHQLLKEMHPNMFETFGGPAIYSYEVGLAKPDIQIYNKLPKIYSPVFFIDDKEPYLVAPEKLRWKGIHYTPYIDHAELIRSNAGHTGKNSSTIKVAKSVDDVVGILTKSGFNI